MRSLLLAILLVSGCSARPPAISPTSAAHGASLRLTSAKLLKGATFKARFELANGATKALAYEHWMTQGPEPVPYCRDATGHIHICALRVFVDGDDEPYVHESYLQPGDSVKFEAIPSKDEHAGVKLWIDGKEEYLWFEHWTPDQALDQVAARIGDHRVAALDLSRKHRPKMAVITPAGQWLTLVDKHARYSLMTEQQLMETDRLWLNASTKGTRYENGAQVVVDVFTVPGKYTIVLTDNLETEPENMNAVTIDVVYGW